MRNFLIIMLMGLLGACSSTQSIKGIGSATDSYKESPCACEIIIQPNIKRG